MTRAQALATIDAVLEPMAGPGAPRQWRREWPDGSFRVRFCWREAAWFEFHFNRITSAVTFSTNNAAPTQVERWPVRTTNTEHPADWIAEVHRLFAYYSANPDKIETKPHTLP